MFISGLHPLFAIAGIGMLAVVADLFGRAVPFYRRELAVESATRLTPLDGLRGILCFGVMYHHSAIEYAFLQTGHWEESPSAFYTLLGQTSVAFFFCITAFLFWGRALDRKGDIPPVAFLRGRFFRIAPLYVFACLAALCLLHSRIDFMQPSNWKPIGKMALMGLRNWDWIGKTDINLINCGVTWTLQYEWVFYIALPAMAMLIRAGSAWRILFLGLAWWAMNGVDHDVDYKAYFLSGILAAHIARMPRVAEKLRTAYVSVILLAILIAMPLVVSGGYGWLPLIPTTLVFIPIASGNSLFGILNYSGLRMMGLVSYSVYLLHGMFLYTGRPLLRQAVLNGDTQYWLSIFVAACAVLIFCSITYRFVEWPFIQFEKRFRRYA